ncbi:hypothetical protein ACX1NX_11495 [Acinetobacter sp. ANC 5383]
MSQFINKESFRQALVLQLITRDLSVDTLIEQAKKIEDYVFQEHLTYIIQNESDRKSLDIIVKGFIENKKVSRKQAF